MAKIRQDGMEDDGDGDNRDMFPSPLKVKLPHESRHKGTVFFVSDVYEREAYGDNEGTEEQMTIYFATNINAILLKMYPNANLTRGYGSYSYSKLYETLAKLNLAEPKEDNKTAFRLLDREGNQVNPFEDADSNEEINNALEDYLRKNLVGMQVKYEIANSKRNTDEEYSTVSKVVRPVE